MSKVQVDEAGLMRAARGIGNADSNTWVGHYLG